MEQLGFLIFREGEPVFSPPGDNAVIIDGDTITLYHKLIKYAQEQNLDITQVPLALELIENGNKVASHSFTLENSASTDIWLIADPAATDPNGSFSDKFVSYMANLSEGKHNFKVNLLVNNSLFQSGNFSFESDGQNKAFKEIAAKFQNAEQVRAQSIADHQVEYSQQMKAEEEKKRREQNFIITVKNESTAHTVYLLVINQDTYSETFYELPPEVQTEIDLPRGSEFVIMYYNQHSSRSQARMLADVNELSDGAILFVS